MRDLGLIGLLMVTVYVTFFATVLTWECGWRPGRPRRHDVVVAGTFAVVGACLGFPALVPFVLSLGTVTAFFWGVRQGARCRDARDWRAVSGIRADGAGEEEEEEDYETGGPVRGTYQYIERAPDWAWVDERTWRDQITLPSRVVPSLRWLLLDERETEE